MRISEKAENYRRPHPAGWAHKKGDPFGWFEVPTKLGGPFLRILASTPDDSALEFDHVSVSLPMRCPTWEEMCKVKDLFFEEEDQVIQYHPPKSEYVNNHRFCLHLWKWTKGKLPSPKLTEVGVK